MKINKIKELGLVQSLMNASMESPMVKICLVDLTKMDYPQLKAEIRRCYSADEKIFDDMIKCAVEANFDGPFNDEAAENLIDATNAFVDFFSYDEALRCLEKFYEDKEVPDEINDMMVEAFTVPFSTKSYKRRNDAIDNVLDRAFS